MVVNINGTVVGVQELAGWTGLQTCIVFISIKETGQNLPQGLRLRGPVVSDVPELSACRD